jgi:hypothetical protein
MPYSAAFASLARRFGRLGVSAFSYPCREACKLLLQAREKRPESPSVEPVAPFRNSPRGVGSGIALKTGVRGTVLAPGGFRPASHSGRLSAGWRRAYRLSGRITELTASDSSLEGADPLDRGDKSAIVKSVDANVPPDQPPSTVDSPSRVIRLGLSASGSAFHASVVASVFPVTIPPAQFSAASPGCGVTPSGLTY